MGGVARTRQVTLDQWQRAAVEAEDPAILVRAQVGSGKTTVLVNKVLWLHQQGVPLSRIAVLTFTNRAAANLRARVAEALADAPEVTDSETVRGEAIRRFRLAGTFHAVARVLLARQLPVAAIGYRRDFRVIDAAERDELWLSLIAANGLKIRHKRLLARRMAGLNDGVILHGAMKHADDLVQLAELTHRAKLAANVMDFDDLLRNTHALLCDYPISPPLHTLLIDELQDCDRDQLDLADRMCGAETRRVAVGDPNQVIYSWRGSEAGLMNEWALRNDARVMTLPMNYRCPEAILEPARLLLQDPGGVPAEQTDADDMVAARDGGEAIAVFPSHDPAAQARWVASRAQAWLAAGCSPDRIGVLCRSKRGLSPVVQALEDAEIPVSQVAADRARDVPVIGWLLRLVRAALAPGNDEAFVLAMTDKRFGFFGEKQLTVAKLQATGDRDVGRVALCSQLAERKRGRNRARARLGVEVAEQLAKFASYCAAAPRSEPEFSSFLRLDTCLQPTASTFLVERAEVAAFVQAWLFEVDASGAFSVPELARALEVVAEAQPARRRREGVAALTIHASKGLEFDHVILIDANDGWIPLASAWRSPSELAEERRLLFVAMTRARESVHISWLRAPGDRRAMGEPSPFLELLPATSVRWLDAPPQASVEVEPAPEPVRAAAPSHGFFVGAQVRHSRYGSGAVVEATEDAIVARFSNVGDKRFSPAMCPLKLTG